MDEFEKQMINSEIQVGDVVIVVRPPTREELLYWVLSWDIGMDEFLDQVCIVHRVDREGFRLTLNGIQRGFRFHPCSLKKISDKLTNKTNTETFTELLNI